MRKNHKQANVQRFFYNYWSVTGSLIFSNLIEADWLNFGKLRANYGTVGNGTTPYQVFNTFGINPPFGGSGSASNPTNKQNPNLKPEEQVNWEVGLEMKLLKNRLGFDVTYYNTENRDQITQVPVTRSTGYARVLLNAGTIENKGIELQLNATPLKSEDFQWDLNINWDKNKSKVLSLLDGIESLELADFQTGLTINAVVGEPYGTIRGRDFVYTNGQKTIGTNGRYLRTATSNNNIGDINPDWKAGIRNSFTYKNFNLSFLVDVKKGGDVFSLDTWYGYATGVYANTAFTNDLGNPVRNTLANGGGVILDGVNEAGAANTVRVAANTYRNPWGYKNAVSKEHTYDASYVKLREVSFGYNFPKQLTDKLKLSALSLTATGKNLWIIHKNTPYADPEAGLSSGNIQGYQSGAYPAIKEFGLNLNLQF